MPRPHQLNRSNPTGPIPAARLAAAHGLEAREWARLRAAVGLPPSLPLDQLATEPREHAAAEAIANNALSLASNAIRTHRLRVLILPCGIVWSVLPWVHADDQTPLHVGTGGYSPVVCHCPASRALAALAALEAAVALAASTDRKRGGGPGRAAWAEARAIVAYAARPAVVADAATFCAARNGVANLQGGSVDQLAARLRAAGFGPALAPADLSHAHSSYLRRAGVLRLAAEGPRGAAFAVLRPSTLTDASCVLYSSRVAIHLPPGDGPDDRNNDSVILAATQFAHRVAGVRYALRLELEPVGEEVEA